MELFEPKEGFDEKDFVVKLTDFLKTLNINEESSQSTPVYDEHSIGKALFFFNFQRIKMPFQLWKCPNNLLRMLKIWRSF
jgi:hypothetical protein